MNPANVYIDPLEPFGGPGPAGALPPDAGSYVGSGANPLTAYGPTSSDAFLGTGRSLDLGIGDPEIVRPKVRPGGGDQTDTSDDPKTIGEHIKNFTTQLAEMPGNIASDFQMALDAGLLTGLLGGYPAMREKLKKVYNPDGSRKYSDAQD